MEMETESELDGIPEKYQERIRRATEEINLEMQKRGLTGEMPEAEVLTISRLMGHSTIELTRTYIAPFDDDLRLGHAKDSPVDHGGL